MFPIAVDGRMRYKDPPTPRLCQMGAYADAITTNPRLAFARRFPGVRSLTMSNPDANTTGRDSGGHRAREQLLDATPATEQRLMLAGISTAVLIGGDGPPIVLLHGPGEFALTWLRVIPELMRSHRVIVPDLPGHGASLLSDAPLDADRVLAWLNELIEQTCPVTGLSCGPLAWRCHRGALRQRTQRSAPWAGAGRYVRPPAPAAVANVHTHHDQLPRQANGWQPRSVLPAVLRRHERAAGPAWPTLATTHDKRPRRRQFTESKGGPPSTHASVRVAGHSRRGAREDLGTHDPHLGTP